MLLLAAAVELDAETALLVADLKRHADPRPTFGLALAALPGAHWDALAPRLAAPPLAPARDRRRPDARVAAAPDRRADPPLPHRAARLGRAARRRAPRRRAPGSALAVAGAARRRAGAHDRGGGRATSPWRIDGRGRRRAPRRRAGARRASSAARRSSCAGRRCPAPGPDLAGIARLIDREALLLPGLPVLEADGRPRRRRRGAPRRARGAGRRRGRRGCDRCRAAASRCTAPWRCPTRPRRGRCGPPRSASRSRGRWRRPVDEVSHHFRLSAAAVDAIARELAAASEGDGAAALPRLCRERARASRSRGSPTASSRWRGGTTSSCRRATSSSCTRSPATSGTARGSTSDWGFAERGPRGLGVTALFAGESGTGKTLAAEVHRRRARARPLPHRPRRDGEQVHRRDGEEPPPPVRRGRGERGRAPLRRGRRALRQARRGQGRARPLRQPRGRLPPAADGVVPRPRDADDEPALERRPRVPPAAALRRAVPVPRRGRAPRDLAPRLPRGDPARRDLDLDALAQLVVSGGSIRSIALSAAFSAAGDGGAVTPEHVRRAARLEFAKAERPPPDWKAAGLA